MRIGRKLIVWTALAAACAIVVAFAMPSYRQGEASIAGKRAKNFTLDLSGKPGHLSDFRGKVVVLNFWATWCKPCIEETPALNKLQAYIDSRGGVVLGVSVDEDSEAYGRFLKDQKVVFAADHASWEIAHEYGSFMVPETYIIDRQGRIARKIIGPQQWDSPDMLAYFDTLLGQT